MKETSRGHGDPAGNVFQNVGGILMNLQMTYALRKAEVAARLDGGAG